MNRRHFLTSTLAGAAALGSAPFALAQNPAPASATKSSPAPGTEPQRPAPFEAALVKEFVGAGHRNIPRVKEMLAVNPALINACWDWGAGDFETALGGASHIGHRPMALLLLESGARMDAFCAAMLGETEIVAALLRLSPACANTRGPHGYSMLYHAGYSGKLAIAEAIGPHLKERARDCNQALQTASLAGHIEFVAWLLKNGVDNPNTKNFQGKTPLDLAIEREHGAIIPLLQTAGGVPGR
ncbi:MAG: ankyrin repeat domain-containing protein [Opitutaceae bacterium]